MLSKIIKFEWTSRFTQGMTILFILMMLFQGVWYTQGFYDYYGGDGMLMNAAGVFYQNLAAGGMLLCIIVAIITGPMLYKDIQLKSAGWVYSLPISDKQFYLGKFFSAYLVNVSIAFFYLIGMILVPYSGIGTEALFGPTPILQLFHGFVLLTMPNLFLLTAICFAAIVMFRTPAAGYLAVFLTIIAFLLMESDAQSSGFSPLNMVADAFGYVATHQQVSSMPIAERNTGFISLSGYLLTNRILWFSISLIVLAISYAKFSFKSFLIAGKKTKTERTIFTADTAENGARGFQLLPESLNLSFSNLAFFKKLWNLSVLELKNIIRPTSFKLIAGILILFAILQNLIWNASYYIGPQVPVTSSMTAFRITNDVFIIMLVMIWAGELFFKDKVVNIWQITGALPVPVWVSQLSKLLAMFGVAFILNFIFMMCGIISQVIQGGAATIDMGLFINDFFGYNWGWINQCFYITLTFFLSGLTGKRFLTHVLGTGYFFVLLLGFELGLLEELRFAFGVTPGFEDYSEMNSYGMWKGASFWYFLTWLSLSVSFVLMGVLFWDRGLANSLLSKLSFRSKQLVIPGKLAILGLVIAFFFLQSFIAKQVNEEGNFEPDVVEEAAAADYERKYERLADLSHPYYTHLDMEVDFMPAERRATYMANVVLTNFSQEPIDSLYLSLPEKVQLLSISQGEKQLDISKVDEEHDIAIIALPTPMDTNTQISLGLEMVKNYTGFSQGDPQAPLMYKGSFSSIEEYLPVLGFDSHKMLEENRTRQEYGLEKLSSLLPEINSPEDLSKSRYRSDAKHLNGTMTISTVKDQTPVGSGKLVESWSENDRTYAKYEVDQLGPLNWCIGSGPYSVDDRSDVNSIYYDAKHPYNVDLFRSFMRRSRAFIQAELGSYPYEKIRLYEIPYYQDEVYAFPGGIALSEKEGWIADTTGLNEQAYLRFMIAKATAEHWIQQNLFVSDVQGADMLRLALPASLALQFVEQELGEEAVTLLREPMIKLYNKKRFNDPNGEPPLLYADGKDYLEPNLGALSLYDWSKEIGNATLNATVKAFSETEPQHTFKKLYQLLLEKTANDKKKTWKEKFEVVAEAGA
ncbi:MAG: hypothetical protein AAGC85_08880 [Bacteroidota bacterium]